MKHCVVIVMGMLVATVSGCSSQTVTKAESAELGQVAVVHLAEHAPFLVAGGMVPLYYVVASDQSSLSIFVESYLDHNASLIVVVDRTEKRVLKTEIVVSLESQKDFQRSARYIDEIYGMPATRPQGK